MFGSDAHYVGGQAVFADGAGKADTVCIILQGAMQGVGHRLGYRPGQGQMEVYD